MYDLAKIRSVHVEATSMCNARCPMCSRYTLDGYTQPSLVETHLDTELYKDLITSIPNLELVYFSGVYGDPCMHPALLDLCQSANMIGVDVQVDSNAGYRKVDFWKELADLDVYVNFAVDGLEDTNKIYRKNVEWKTVISNMKAFAAAGGKGRWNFIVFKHNEHQVEEARKIAEDLGLDFRVKITQKFRRAKVWDVMINGSKAYEIKPPTDTKYRHSNISDKPYSISYPPMAKNLSDVEIDCKALKNREIFLSYQGLVLPCCYLGSIHGQSPASQQLASLDLSPYDLSKHSLDEILVNLNQISDSWNNTIDDGRLIMCAQTCAKSRQQHTLYE